MTGGGDDLDEPLPGAYGWTASTTALGRADGDRAQQRGAHLDRRPSRSRPTRPRRRARRPRSSAGRYYTSASVGFTTGDGSDAGAGLDTSRRLVERAEAPLTNGACGGFCAFGGSYSSPDTSVVSGNCYRYRFTIADNVGNVSTALVTVDAKVDTSAPTATMDDPGANLLGTVVLTSTTGDPESGVATVTYQHSPAGLNTWTANASSWNTTGVADGLYDLRVAVTSNAGTTTNSALVASRRVDNTAPSASMDDPGSPLSDIVPLTSTASDGSGSGLDTATFQYSYQGTGPWTTIGTDSSAPFGLDWDTNAGLDGRYNLRVIVTDVAGNSTTSSNGHQPQDPEPTPVHRHHVARELHQRRLAEPLHDHCDDRSSAVRRRPRRVLPVHGCERELLDGHLRFDRRRFHGPIYGFVGAGLGARGEPGVECTRRRR